ncbi:MAG TPA: hypothetical protein VFH46_07090 [Pyrinomonadaceae bacterium]|nr:hypothetical protein [Pyrinomonadaceae bacterium]
MIPEGLFNWISNWLPPYTEQWATTYLQVLFESFLFALGVPTAMYSLIVDEDIKRVAQTRVKARRYFVVTTLLYVAAFIIVWFLHPEPPRPDMTTRQQTTASSETREGKNVRAASPEVSAGEPEEAPPSRGFTPIVKSIFAAFTVTFLPFVVLITGVTLNSQFKREKVVQRLADELLKNLDAKSSIDTIALKDLSYLGEHGRAGDEKEMVLNVIDNLADKLQAKVRTEGLAYNGYELESLIRHIPPMLDNSSRPGSDQNYLRAVEVLSNIWRWLSIRKGTSDAGATLQALKVLALRSVDSMTEETSLAYLEIAAECDSHIVFDMGEVAINARKYRLVVGALSKLESMASSAVTDNDLGRETKANLLGIAAHLATDGPSGARRAEKALHYNQELFKPSLREALVDAFDYQYSAGRFDIADKINLLITEAAKMKTVELDRPAPFVMP